MSSSSRGSWRRFIVGWETFLEVDRRRERGGEGASGAGWSVVEFAVSKLALRVSVVWMLCAEMPNCCRVGVRE